MLVARSCYSRRTTVLHALHERVTLSMSGLRYFNLILFTRGNLDCHLRSLCNNM